VNKNQKGKIKMKTFIKTIRIKITIITLFFLSTLCLHAQESNREIGFNKVQGTETDHEQTLKSIVTIRDISEQYSTGGLYLITHYGNLDSLFQKENQKLIDHPWIEQTWRFCSIFSTKTKNGVIMGRNWDNQNVGSIIVSYYKPDNGYASVSFLRAIDMGFPLNVKLDEMAQTPFGDKLLLAPFYAYDGMNEHGLCAAVTGINSVKVKPVNGKESIFLGYIIRKILDKAKSVEEAVNLADKIVPFDITPTEINCHFFFTDAAGKSVILEYLDNEWKKTYHDKNWQVMTNKIIFNNSNSALMAKCWRYESISSILDKTKGEINWQQGMKILKDVSQKGTTWSVVYSPTNKDLYFSVYQTWEKIFHLNLTANSK
jgi:predicted choloylglycine hydrolase